jgi:hypothetical protein
MREENPYLRSANMRSYADQSSLNLLQIATPGKALGLLKSGRLGLGFAL